LRLAIDQIIVSKDNPRQSFDEEGLRRLGESIKSHGQLQAIIVRRRGQSFELIVGERRLRASALVGLDSIDAEVKDVDDTTAMELRLIENTQREDLTHAEKGDAVYGLWAMDKYDTIKEVAEAINISYDLIKSQWLPKARKLSEVARKGVIEHTIDEMTAKRLVKYPLQTQDKLARIVSKKSLSQRQAIQFLKLFDANPDADLGNLTNEVKGIKNIEIPESFYTPELKKKIEDEKKQLAKVTKIKRKKPSKPITKEQVIKKFENKKAKIANSAFKFEKVKVLTGKSNNNSTPLKPEIKPVIIHNENTPDYSLCQCANCPLFGKHCKGRCWND